MLRCTFVWLGRWNSRDFLKGRGKRAGAVHVRHTHGSKGRYKRLTDMYGIRDGRRHAQNRMKGGLGIKLGGGLFGLRMPRQHLLSTMTREQLDLELHGHPNITNPYRDFMDEHPDLKAVMESASVLPYLVLLLPRVPRDLSDGATAAVEIPPAWRRVGDELTSLLASFFLTTQVRFCTLDASVEISFPSATEAPDLSSERTASGPLHAALLALYRQHCRTGRQLVKDRKSAVPLQRRRHHKHSTLPLFGAEMQRAASSSPPSYTSAALAALIQQEAAASVPPAPAVKAAREADNEATGKLVVSGQGVSDVVHELRERFPDALCVCLRPSAIVAPSTHCSSIQQEDASAGAVAAPEEARGRAALEQLKAVLEKSKAKQRPHPSPADAAGDDVTRARKARQLLKTDVDPDTQKGVWAAPATERLGELLRWQYANRDPRAHNGDSVPHRARRLPCVMLVDLSKRPLPRRPQQPVQSLLPDEVSNALATLRYVPLRSSILEEALADLRDWHVESSWNKMLELKHHKPKAAEAGL